MSLTKDNFFKKKWLLITVGVVLTVVGIIILITNETSQLLGYLLIFLGIMRIFRAFL